jgi:hypothetical protein
MFRLSEAAAVDSTLLSLLGGGFRETFSRQP